MKRMILSLKIEGDVISHHFLMLWFQKDSLDTVGFRTYGGGSRVLNQKVTFRVLNVPRGAGRDTCLGLSPKKYQVVLTVSLKARM